MSDVDPAIVDAIATLLRRQVVPLHFFAPYLEQLEVEQGPRIALAQEELRPLVLAQPAEIRAAIRVVAARPGRARFMESERVLDLLARWRARYPESVYPPVKPGEALDQTCRVGPHMARHVLDLLRAELEALVTQPEPEPAPEDPLGRN